ncbi:negative elongation factor E-like [Amblyraja radiata]|uniref:negative elongation factor E-like n=1 Tax=Amblyraja radiata TaxID=386614 RepID=UPI001402690B|nr:negative elongation factor E-like [Amblyraja radiata]
MAASMRRARYKDGRPAVSGVGDIIGGAEQQRWRFSPERERGGGGDDAQKAQWRENKMRKKKKALLAFKKQSSGAQSSQGGINRSLYDQSLTDTATATVEAKKLVKTGAISAITAENKNSGFKRSHTLEGKLKMGGNHKSHNFTAG